jgi:DNA invertase Pin-like site-specific DNA recombinase
MGRNPYGAFWRIKKTRILELRQKGYGYKSIASILGIKRDTVRSLCKKYGLEGYLGLGISKEFEPKIREKNTITTYIVVKK